MTDRPAVLVSEVIDASPISRLQCLVIAACFACVAIDGFDTAVIGFAAPAIAGEWNVGPDGLAVLFGSALLGSIVGSAFFGPLGDRIGRTRALVVATATFGLLTLLAGFARNLVSLEALRFLAGMGLGGVLPCAIALTSEYAPAHRRSALVNLMFCGYTLGAASSGFIAAWLIPLHGWRMVFLVGGALPVLVAGLCLLVLPESLNFLALHDHRRAEIKRILARIAPDLAAHGWTPEPVARGAASPASELFRLRPLAGTLLLWVTAFCGLMTVYLLNSWMPLLLTKQGYSIRDASVIGAMFQVGGTLGAIMLGMVMDRRTPNRVLALASLFAAFFLLLIGLIAHQSMVLAMVLFCTGVCVPGAQVGASAYAASWYPTRVRTTGVSWMSGMGRVGSLIGSVGGGTLVALGLGMGGIMGLLALPMAGAAIALALHERVRVGPVAEPLQSGAVRQ